MPRPEYLHWNARRVNIAHDENIQNALHDNSSSHFPCVQ